MKIQYCSDLHLEFSDNIKYIRTNPIIPSGDILILAGDIIPFVYLKKASDFFKFCSDNFEFTYWLPGNHEYYYSDVSERSGTFREEIFENVILINNTTVHHEDIRIIFSTLWSNISPAYEWDIENGLSDFQVIKYNGYRLSVPVYNKFHSLSQGFIESEISKTPDGKNMVVSHHVPTYLHYPEKYKDSNINEAFATELSAFINSHSIDYWIYGHHHYNVPDFHIGTAQMLTNQLGYTKYSEQIGYQPNKAISL